MSTNDTNGTNGNGSANGSGDADDKKLLATAGTEARRASFGPGGGIGIPAERSDKFGSTLKRLGDILGTEKPRLFAVFVLTVVSVILVVIGPKLLGDATNIIVQGVVSGQGIDFDELHSQLITVMLVYAGSFLLSYTSSYVLAGVVQRSMFGLREEVERKLNHLPLSYIDRQPRGDLLSRVTNDIDNLAQSLQQTTSQILTSLLTLIGVTIMMFTISPLLALIALTTVPLSVWLMKVIGGKARPRFMDQWRHTGALNAQAEEVFSGHAIVKSFGRQREAEARFRADNDQLYEASFAAQFMANLIQPAMLFMGNIQYILIAVVGGLQISSGSLSIGDMQAMIQYARQFSQPLTHLASMAATFQSGIASLERVLELVDADEQSAEQELSTDPLPVKGRVVFEDVHFAYDPDKPLITGLNVTAEPGETVAIVGPTGAGKTTLVNLIMRFYEIDSGRITLDGRDIVELPAQRAAFRHRHGVAGHVAVRWHDPREPALRQPRRHRRADLRGRPGHLRRPFRALVARRVRHDHQRRGRQHLDRREAADDDRPSLPQQSSDPDPRRGDQLGRHSYRGVDPGGDEQPAGQSHELRDRSPAFYDPRRGRDPRDGGRPDRRTGQPRLAPRSPRRLLALVQRPVRRQHHLTDRFS